MGNQTDKPQSGGIDISGSVGNVGGDLVGRDKTTTITQTYSQTEISSALQPVADVVARTEETIKPVAEQKLEAIKAEVRKGNDADDSVVGGLVRDLVGLVPQAATAIASAFGSPILGAIAGPVTKFVIDGFKAKSGEA